MLQVTRESLAGLEHLFSTAGLLPWPGDKLEHSLPGLAVVDLLCGRMLGDAPAYQRPDRKNRTPLTSAFGPRGGRARASLHSLALAMTQVYHRSLPGPAAPPASWACVMPARVAVEAQ